MKKRKSDDVDGEKYVDLKNQDLIGKKIKRVQQWRMDGGGYRNGNGRRCGGDGFNDGVKTMVVVVMEIEAVVDTWKRWSFMIKITMVVVVFVVITNIINVVEERDIINRMEHIK